MRFRQLAKGRVQRKPGTMNNTEAEYSLLLRAEQSKGLVEWFQFEGITLKLAHDTRYTADFAVMGRDGTLEIHEVKGARKRGTLSGSVSHKPHFEDDAKVKIQVAAAMFPFRFFVCWKSPTFGWRRDEVKV